MSPGTVDPVNRPPGNPYAYQADRRGIDRAAPADAGTQLAKMAKGKRDGDPGRLRALLLSRLEPVDRAQAEQLATRWGLA